MLENIRRGAGKWFAGFIIIMISITFSLWGISSYFTGVSSDALAVVGGHEIRQSEFQRFYQQQYQQMEAMYGEAFRKGMIDEAMLKRQLLQTLINQALLVQDLQKAGFAISDEQLVKRIYQIPAFQTEGKFDQEHYRQLLSQAGYTPSQFEAKLREDLVVEQFRSALEHSIIVPAQLIDEFLRLRDQKREISYVRISSQPAASAAIDEQLVKTYYQEHQTDFMTPDRVRLDYLVLSAEQAQTQVGEPDEQTLRKLYQSELTHYTQPEQRKVRHILIMSKDKDDATAKAQAEQIRQQLVAGKPFADLARQYSQDPGSADKGGDLGWISSGMMEPTFDKAAFTLPARQPSPVIKTRFGYHIVLVDEIKPAQVQAFEQVRDQVIAEYKQQAAAQRLGEMTEKLATLTFENPSSLEPASKALGLTVQHTDWITRADPNQQDIAASDKVREAAFSTSVMQEGINSQPLELEDGRRVVLRVREHQAPVQKPLAEVHDEVVAKLKREQALQHAINTAKQIQQQLDKPNANLMQIAATSGLIVQTLGLRGRDYGEGDVGVIVKAAFSVPLSGQRGATVTALPNGDQVVAWVTQVVDGDSKQVATGERNTVKQQLVARQAEQQLDAYVSGLKDRYKIQAYPDRLH
jgi:peptidyl-prolyl cis-trans isomerase D